MVHPLLNYSDEYVNRKARQIYTTISVYPGFCRNNISYNKKFPDPSIRKNQRRREAPCYHFYSLTPHSVSLIRCQPNTIRCKGRSLHALILRQLPINNLHLLYSHTPLRSHLPSASIYPSQPAARHISYFQTVSGNSL